MFDADFTETMYVHRRYTCRPMIQWDETYSELVSEVTLNSLSSKASSNRNILLERQAATTRTHIPLTENDGGERRVSVIEKPPLTPPPKLVAKKKKKKRNSVTANLGGTKYEVSKYSLLHVGCKQWSMAMASE